MNSLPKLCATFSCLLLCALMLNACAPARWMPISERKLEITWPSPPNPPRVHYLGEISGFQQYSKNLSSMITGKSRDGNIVKPVAIAVGPEDRMAIADQGREGIHLYIPATQEYQFIYMAGEEKIHTPVGLTFDNESRLYVTDSQLKKILVFDASGEHITSIGRAGKETLKRPTGITFNTFDKRLYVSDSLMHQILIFSLHGEFLGHIGGSRGEGKGSFNFPTHLGTDYNGNVYVTDSMNFRAQIFSPASNKWQQFGKHGDGAGDFASPKGIDVDSNSIIYIAETLFDSIQLFDREGTFLLTVGSQGSGPGEFWMPSGLFIDHKDRLYVCDTYNQRIQFFQLATESLPANLFQEKAKK